MQSSFVYIYLEISLSGMACWKLKHSLCRCPTAVHGLDGQSHVRRKRTELSRAEIEVTSSLRELVHISVVAIIDFCMHSEAIMICRRIQVAVIFVILKIAALNEVVGGVCN